MKKNLRKFELIQKYVGLFNLSYIMYSAMARNGVNYSRSQSRHVTDWMYY